MAANLIMPVWIDTQLKVVGVELRILGRHNLEWPRPAVFVFSGAAQLSWSIQSAHSIETTPGVPVIPIVIRNALDVAARDGRMRPGIVDVALPPISVGVAEPRKLAANGKEVRQLFIERLSDWPLL